MKSKNQVELKTYRNIKSEFLIAETAKNAEVLDEAKQIQILRKYAAKLEKSILDFSQADREDLVAEYRDELEIVKKLLPEPVNESQIDSKLMEWCAENGFRKEIGKIIKPYNQQLYNTTIPKKEIGSAIKYLKSKFPQADGKIISDIVKKYVI